MGYSLWGHKESDTTERLHFMMDYLMSDLPFYHSIQKSGQNINNNYLQILDNRLYWTMVQERKEKNEENSDWFAFQIAA